MKEKITSILIVGIFVLSGLGAVATNNNVTENNGFIEKTSTLSLSFSPVYINDYSSKYLEITMEDTSNSIKPGEPVLPRVVKTLELPFGVKNVNIKVTPKNIQEYKVDKEIRPGPEFLPLATISNAVEKSDKNHNIYSNNEEYPSSWIKYRVSCGLNDAYKHVTNVAIQTFPVRYNPSEGYITVAEEFDITINYLDPEKDVFPVTSTYDLVIIAPGKFEGILQKLVNHKNSMNPPIKTTFMETDDIYSNPAYNDGDSDKSEMIKYYIEEVVRTMGVKYVLLVGGLDSLIYGKPRDNANEGSKDWYVPVRYNNIFDNPKYPLDDVAYDPGVITDLYYADLYKEGGVFEDWDPNGDGIICSWGKEGYVNDTGVGAPTQIDWDPDVSVGRLACRNKIEVRSMVNKIINYEKNAYGSDWFNKILAVSGDGFLDQEPLDIEWDTTGLDNGDYTLYAQSKNHDDPPLKGPIDIINFTINKDIPTNLTFNHDDHLKISEYPGKPIAEICSISEGNNIGNNNTFCKISDKWAYCNQFLDWANIEYTDGVLFIRGKSYDPQEYGYITDIKVWINNSIGETVFTGWKNDTEQYYEGEWATGERELLGAGGALYYVPPEFETELLWTSNGLWTGEESFADAFNQGSGFTFVSGHGSPYSWGNHYAGIPGNRRYSHIGGIDTVDRRLNPPIFPMQKLSNKNKPPVTLVGGCHNSQFNVSFLTTMLKYPKMWTYGVATPECWSWWLTRLAKRGSIATIGNTGLGYGVLGKECTSVGLDGGICIEFFKQIGEGHRILGDVYLQTQKNYVLDFDMELQEHGKTLSQWILNGDPSLRLGGYEITQNQVVIDIPQTDTTADGVPNNPVSLDAYPVDKSTPNSYEWSFDTDGDDIYDTSATGDSVTQTWEKPGVYWVQVKAIYDDYEETTETIVEIEYEEFPDTPTKPSGQKQILANIQYRYKTSSEDPAGNDLWYIFDWGDGEHSLVGPVKSGKTATGIHKWKENGNYEVKVMAINEFAYWSDFSDPLEITVPRTRDTTNNLLFYLLQRFFSNNPNFFPILKQILGL